MHKTGHTLSDAEISVRYQALGNSLAMPAYFYPAVAEFVGGLGSQVVFDAGCGTGDLLAEVQKLNPHAKLLGVELAPSRVEVAQRRLGINADIRCGSITSVLPFATACADVLLVTEVLEHLKDPVAVLKNILPVLKPDGVAIITFPNAAAWLPWAPLAERLTPIFKPARGFLPHEHPFRTLQPIDTAFSFTEVKALLTQSGLRVKHSACYEVFPYCAEFVYKFAPHWDIAPVRRPFDQIATRLGWVNLGYRVFTRCVVVQ